MKRTPRALWALAFAPAAAFAQSAPVTDSNGFRPSRLPGDPVTAPDRGPAPRGAEWTPLGPFGGDVAAFLQGNWNAELML